ncbi:MAG: glycosyltransferase, partial [bacterium]|nr:glycosyltransferase [bacterium]
MTDQSPFPPQQRGLRLIMGLEKMDVKKERTLIIIPTYNEKGNIRPLIAEIIDIVPWVDVLVVDDGSPDGTGQLVKEFAQQHEEAKTKGETEAKGTVIVMEREGERGLGGAYRAGLKYGMEKEYEILMTMDADHSHNPLHLRAMLS